MVVFAVGMAVMLICETFLGGILHLLYGNLAPDVHAAHILWNVLLFCGTPLILSYFSELDAETRRLAPVLVIIHNGIGMVAWPMSFVFPNMLRAMNDVRWPMFISICSMILVRVGISYAIAGPLHSGVLAVWIAMIADWLVRIVCFLLRYRSGAWMTLSRCKPKPE